MPAHLTYRRLDADAGCIGVIRFNIWLVPLAEPFGQAVDALRDCRGMIVDLRGNPGGVGAMVMGLGGHFLDRQEALGIMRTRETVLRFVANPRWVGSAGQPVEPFAGALAILIDRLSVSTSEIFAAGMQTVGRARLFGETTAGQALPAVLTRLPNGDVLMHVIADFTAPDGTRIEGRGAVPDVATPLTRAALLAGQDPAFDAAVRWIAERPAPSGDTQ
jgi:carboxyl-terminal processing protease